MQETEGQRPFLSLPVQKWGLNEGDSLVLYGHLRILTCILCTLLIAISLSQHGAGLICAQKQLALHIPGCKRGYAALGSGFEPGTLQVSVATILSCKSARAKIVEKVATGLLLAGSETYLLPLD